MNELDEQKRIFAKNLTDQLAIRGLLQADLVRALKTTSASVGYWCTGKQIPRMDTVQAICDYLHISKSVLLEDHSDEEPVVHIEFTDDEELAMLRALKYYKKFCPKDRLDTINKLESKLAKELGLED